MVIIVKKKWEKNEEVKSTHLPSDPTWFHQILINLDAGIPTQGHLSQDMSDSMPTTYPGYTLVL